MVQLSVNPTGLGLLIITLNICMLEVSLEDYLAMTKNQNMGPNYDSQRSKTKGENGKSSEQRVTQIFLWRHSSAASLGDLVCFMLQLRVDPSIETTPKLPKSIQPILDSYDSYAHIHSSRASYWAKKISDQRKPDYNGRFRIRRQ